MREWMPDLTGRAKSVFTEASPAVQWRRELSERVHNCAPERALRGEDAFSFTDPRVTRPGILLAARPKPNRQQLDASAPRRQRHQANVEFNGSAELANLAIQGSRFNFGFLDGMALRHSGPLMSHGCEPGIADDAIP